MTEAGDSSNPTVVLLHAIATNAAMWEPQLARLARQFHVIALDMLGHGASPPAPPGASFADYALAVLQTLDALGIRQASFAGLSFGSMVAQRLVSIAPDRVTALALSNGVALATDSVRQAWGERIFATVLEGPESQVQPTLERWFTAPFRAAHAAEVARIGEMIAATSKEGYVAAAHAIMTLDHRELLSHIAAPTLVLAGEFDHAAPYDAVRAIADAIPGAKFVALRAAHLMNIEIAEEYSAVLAGFFGEALAPGIAR